MIDFEIVEKLIESDHTLQSHTLDVVLDKTQAEQRGEWYASYYQKWNSENKHPFLEVVNGTETQNIGQETVCAVSDEETGSDGIVDCFHNMILTDVHEHFEKIGNSFKKDFRVTIGLAGYVSNYSHCWNQKSWTLRIDHSYNDNTKAPCNVRSETIANR